MLSDYEKQGLAWLRGDFEVVEWGEIKLNPKQNLILNDKTHKFLVSGGMASGKTLAWIIKIILYAFWFPGSKFLVGRKTKENAQETFMKDFTELIEIGMPGAAEAKIYNHMKGYGRVDFTNGSTIEFWGLDALQSGATTDIKKAEQKLKSHNFTFICVDQLEDIEKKVFDALLSRMRRRGCSHGSSKATIFYNKLEEPVYEVCNVCEKVSFNQFLSTTNPANFWGYDFFKANPQPMTKLVETSMMDNKANLSEAFLKSELMKPARYVQKYVHGEWSPESLVESAVFSEGVLKEQMAYIKEPLRTIDGIKIFDEVDKAFTYQIGIDPSTGAVDPSCIKVICVDNGEEVASFSGFVPTGVITEKALILAEMFTGRKRPLIVPEATGIGQALVEDLKKKYENIYEREVFSQREKIITKKLGFYTNHANKEHLIENGKKLFSKHFIKIRENETRNELQTFIYTDEARKQGAGAQTGYHDDRVMALLLAYWNVEPKTHREKNLLSLLDRRKKKRVVKYNYS